MSERPFRLPNGNPHSLTAYIMRYKRQFFIHSLGGVFYNTIIVGGPILLGYILDAAFRLENEGPSPEGVKPFILYCLLFLAVTIFFQYARYLKRWYILDLTNRMTNDMRAGIFDSVVDRPSDQIEKESVGDLMSRTVGDVDQIVSTSRSTIVEVWDTWLLMASYFVALLYYSPVVTLLCSIPIPFALLAAEAVRHPLYRVSLQSRKASSRVTSHLQRTIHGTHILRLFGREETEWERLKDYCQEQVKWNLRNSLFQSGMLPVYTTIASIGVFGILYWGGQKVTSGEWSVGYFTSYLAMFMAMTGRTQKAADVMNQFHAARASWDRIKEKITAGQTDETPYEETNPSDDRRLIVKGLHFKYPNAAENAIHNISFGANHGEFIGITGSVGCGKSALAAALTGLYPYSGSVVIHGRELKNFSANKRVQIMGYSGQDPFLFSSTIAENITLQPKEQIVFDQRLQQAIYISALAEDLPLFPEGLETMVGEKGIRISGGQRQRIALARAIYTQSPVLILDEPFSAVDIGTEQRMIERLRQELSNTTILLFSHRLSAFSQADRIIVLDKGSIAEHGTHQELILQKGIYEKIYSAQHWMESEEAGIA